MAKKLTLNETWRLCLDMWAWIAEQKRAGNRKDVGSLKREWLENNWSGCLPYLCCFFCEYASYRRKDEDTCLCLTCPGALVGKRFNCMSKTHHYGHHPIAFYNKLVSLNKKRKKK